MTLDDALAVIKAKSFVDLAYSFEPGIPHWPGFPDEERETVYSYEEGGGTMGTGFFAQRYSLVGQWGTHCDPPAHFVNGKRTIDQIDVREMILPLVVIDVHQKAVDCISLNTMVRQAVRVPLPLVRFVLRRTVANVDSIPQAAASLAPRRSASEGGWPVLGVEFGVARRVGSGRSSGQ